MLGNLGRPPMLSVDVGGGCLDITSLPYHISFLSSSLLETVQYRLIYYFKEPLNPKTTNQQTNKKLINYRKNKIKTHILNV